MNTEKLGAGRLLKALVVVVICFCVAFICLSTDLRSQSEHTL